MIVMDKKKVYCLVSTIKDWPEERKKDAICVLESLRACFSIQERIAEQKEKDGKVCFRIDNNITTELSEIINQIKA